MAGTSGVVFLLILLLALAASCARGTPALDTVTIGAVLPLSGEFASLGRSMRNGIELALATAAPGDAVEGLAFPAHFAPDDRARAVRLFRERYRRAHGQDPDMMAALGYDAMRLVLEALRRAGSADRRLLRDAIAGVRRFDGATGRITFEGSPDPRKDVVIVRIRDGRAVFHARVNP